MAHDRSHDDGRDDTSVAGANTGRLTTVFVLSLAILAIEVIGAFATNSRRSSRMPVTC
jgi:Co/Zn/Cd efflux system component